MTGLHNANPVYFKLKEFFLLGFFSQIQCVFRNYILNPAAFGNEIQRNL